jgi:hypothetical protein
MLPTTIDLLKAGLKADPTVSPSDRIRLLAMLRVGLDTQAKTAPLPDAAPRVIRRKEAARRFACCVRVIDRLAQEGKLKRVRLPGRVRAAGFLESEINQLIAANGQ